MGLLRTDALKRPAGGALALPLALALALALAFAAPSPLFCKFSKT